MHAVEFSRIGRSWCFTSRLSCQGNFSNLPLSFSVSNRPAGSLLKPTKGRLDRVPEQSQLESLNCLGEWVFILCLNSPSFKMSCGSDRIQSLLRPASSSACRTFGVTSKNFTWTTGALANLPVIPGVSPPDPLFCGDFRRVAVLDVPGLHRRPDHHRHATRARRRHDGLDALRASTSSAGHFDTLGTNARRARPAYAMSPSGAAVQRKSRSLESRSTGV